MSTVTRSWKFVVGAAAIVGGLVAANQFAFNGVPVTYNYGFYGGGQRLAIETGAGPGGGPHIRVVNPANLNSDWGSFMTFQPGDPTNYSGGTYVARGDLNGDGTTGEIIIGQLGVVKLRSASGAPVAQDITPYGTSFKGEVRVASADLDGDGKAEIITAPGPGGGPHIRAFEQNGTPFAGQMGSGIFAYASDFTGGVYVAAADLNGDGKAEIITGAGPGGGPHVRAFSANGNKMAGQIGDGFYAYGSNFTGGVRVAAGYFDNSGIANIVTAPGPGGGPHIRQFNNTANPVPGQRGDGFMAYAPNFTGGVFVAVGDVDSDEPAEIITGAGAGGGPHVRAFDLTTAPVPGQLGSGFFAYSPSFTGGVTVAAGKV